MATLTNKEWKHAKQRGYGLEIVFNDISKSEYTDSVMFQNIAELSDYLSKYDWLNIFEIIRNDNCVTCDECGDSLFTIEEFDNFICENCNVYLTECERQDDLYLCRVYQGNR